MEISSAYTGKIPLRKYAIGDFPKIKKYIVDFKEGHPS